MNLWFGQANAFLKILNGRESAKSTAIKNREFAFVQYYDVVERKGILIDVVEKALGCIRLSRTHGDFDGDLIPSKYFGL